MGGTGGGVGVTWGVVRRSRPQPEAEKVAEEKYIKESTTKNVFMHISLMHACSTEKKKASVKKASTCRSGRRVVLLVGRVPSPTAHLLYDNHSNHTLLTAHMTIMSTGPRLSVCLKPPTTPFERV